MMDVSPNQESSGVLVARNSLYNLAGQAVTIGVTIVTAPFLVKGLTEEIFGLLVIVWLLVGYLSFLDFGMGSASIKYLSEYFGRGQIANAKKTIWVSSLFSLGVGLAGSLLVIVFTPVLVERILRISVGLQDTARTACYFVAVGLPFVLLQGTLRSVPVSLQKFGILNLAQAVGGILQWGGSLVVVIIGYGLVEVVALTVVVRVLGAVFFLFYVVLLLREKGKSTGPVEPTLFPKLIRYGGWVTVSQVVNPLISYIDRIFIGSLVSMQAVAYYTIPSEAINRLQVVPQSLSSALFPALAEKGTGGSQLGDVRRMYLRSLGYIFVAMLPISFILAIYSSDILEIWMGQTFAEQSSAVFKLLALGIFLHAIAYVPVTALLAIGRPDITAKLNVAEVPIFVTLCLVLIPRYGIEGAAIAWVTRLALITGVLLWVCQRRLAAPGQESPMAIVRRGALLNLFLLVILVFSKSWLPGLLLNTLVLCSVVAGYAVALWTYGFDEADRRLFARMLSV